MREGITEKINDILSSMERATRRVVWYNHKNGLHSFAIVDKNGHLKHVSIAEDSIHDENIIDNVVFALKRMR